MKIFKIGFLVALLSLASMAHAEEPNDWQKLGLWLSKQQLHAGTLVKLTGETSAVTYLEGISIGQEGLGVDPKAKSYVDFDFGGSFNRKESRVLFLIMFHPQNIAESIWEKLPIKNRVRFRGLPDIEIGPAIDPPLGGVWRANERIGLVASVQF